MFDVKKLEKETLILFIISTQGEGEFPLNAKDFYENLVKETFNLTNLISLKPNESITDYIDRAEEYKNN